MALIGSVFMPALAVARERYRVRSCIANLTQLGLASLVYAQDYGGRYPPLVTRAGGRTYLVYHVLIPYARDARFWQCPADPVGQSHQDLAWAAERMHEPPLAPLNVPLITYGVNAYVMNPTNRPPYSLDELPRPSDTALWYDALLATDGASFHWPLVARHRGSCNIGFCDGSVRAFRCSADSADSSMVTSRFARTRNGGGVSVMLSRVNRGPYAGRAELWGVILRDGTKYPSDGL